MDGDLLIYGCDLAATERGEQFVDSLARLTGADVAASDDPTGHADLGGDWELEYRSGDIESDIPLDQDVQDDWSHTLAIATDNVSTGTTVSTSLTISHTTDGTNRLMLVGVSLVGMTTGPSGDPQVNSMTYNGANLAFVGTQINLAGDAVVEIWQLVAPDTGTHDLDINFGGNRYQEATAGVMSFTGVDQTTPLGSFFSANGNSSNPTVTLGSASGELVFDVVSTKDNIDRPYTPGASQTEYWDLYSGSQANGSGSVESGSASVTMSRTIETPDHWAIGAVAIKPFQGTTFQQDDANAYNSTQDTYLNAAASNTSYGTIDEIQVDLDDGVADPTAQGLLRFDSIFGNGAGQIPLGSTINSASLTLNVNNISDPAAQIELYRMLTAWSESSTWNSMTGGISADGVEAKATSDATISSPDASGQIVINGLAAALQAWSDGDTNYGWAIISNSTNGWDADSSENATQSNRPMLSVDYTLNDPAVVITEFGGSTNITEGGATDTLNLVLNRQPTADVTVTLTPDGESDLGSGVGVPHNLTFTSANWNQSQVVTVTANDDAAIEGSHTSTITYSTSSTDPEFDGLTTMSPQVSDTFTASSNIAITAHTPDAGTLWTEVYDTGPGTDATIDAALDVVKGGADQNNAGQAYTAGPPPAGVDQTISFTLSTIDTTNGTKPVGVFGRRLDNDNFYYLQILPNDHAEHSLQLSKLEGGVRTVLGSVDATITAGDTFKLEITDTVKKIYHNGTEVVSSVDNALTAAGTWGVYFGDFNGSVTGTS